MGKMMTKLYKYLDDNGLKQTFFAKKLKITLSAVNMLALGKSAPSLDLAYRIEELTNGQVTVYDWKPYYAQKRREAAKKKEL
jgi:transcriptional regulator with XRE-family HTH domain